MAGQPRGTIDDRSYHRQRCGTTHPLTEADNQEPCLLRRSVGEDHSRRKNKRRAVKFLTHSTSVTRHAFIEPPREPEVELYRHSIHSLQNQAARPWILVLIDKS